MHKLKLEFGKWYWIKLKNSDEYFPAMYDEYASGNWTNCDTWEDFHNEVEDIKELKYPSNIKNKIKKIVMKLKNKD